MSPDVPAFETLQRGWTAVLIVTRGLPGSGKSTWARKWVAADKAHRAEVNRDQLRNMLHGGYADAENLVTAVRDAAILTLLRKGVSVVSSDTNLRPGDLDDFLRLARQTPAGVTVADFIAVSVETCIARDARRSGAARVGEAVIRDMHGRYLAPIERIAPK